MKRLITFGCSHTYGHGLDDCCLPNLHPGLDPSKFSWPAVLANQLGVDLVNLSIPGASNKLIWKTILDTEFLKNDVVITMWTYIERWAIFNDTTSTIDIVPTYTSSSTNIYYRNLYSKYDSIIDFYNRCNFIQYYLNSKEIQNYHLVVNPIDFVPEWNNVKIEFDAYKYKYWPKAKDNSHFGKEAHKDIADRVFEILKN